jgi:hypothetical protein
VGVITYCDNNCIGNSKNTTNNFFMFTNLHKKTQKNPSLLEGFKLLQFYDN